MTSSGPHFNSVTPVSLNILLIKYVDLYAYEYVRKTKKLPIAQNQITIVDL